MKHPTLFCFLLVTILLGACASVGTNLGPSFTEWDTDEHRQYVKVTFTNTHAFSPSTTTTMMLECRDLSGILGRDNKSDEEILRDSQCRPADVGRHDVGAGVFPGFGGAIIQSAGIVGSAYLIGKGLGDSGTTYSSETTLTDDSRTNNNLRQVNDADVEMTNNNQKINNSQRNNNQRNNNQHTVDYSVSTDINVNENIGVRGSSVGGQ